MVLVTFFKAAPLLIVFGLLLIASSLLSMIGRVLCLTVPRQVGATALIYFAVGFDFTALLAWFARMIPGLPNVSGISGLLSVLGTVLFVLYLRTLATYIKSDDLVHKASGVLILCGYVVFFFAASLVVMLVSALFAMIMWLVIVVILLLTYFRYFQLLSDLRLSLE